MQKYTQKCETYTPPTADHAAAFKIVSDPSVHGTTGPIQSGHSAYIFDIVKTWVPTWVSRFLPPLARKEGLREADLAFRSIFFLLSQRTGSYGILG